MENIQSSEQQTEKKHKSISKFFFVAFFIVVFLVASFSGAFFGFISGTLGQFISQKYFPNLFGLSKNEEILKQEVIQEDSAVTSVVEKTSPSVVSVIVTKDIPKMGNILYNPFGGNFEEFFNQFFDSNQNQESEEQQIGGGTGFFISQDGMIVTNKHVVNDSEADYTVITSDGEKHNAKILAKDPVNDLAVLKIDGNNLPILELGNSDNIKIGQTAIAIGNSLGEFSNTVSRGIISGLGRNVTAFSGNYFQQEELTNIIQTDAAINPGNSGGPLLDINGKVIGINVAIVQGAENIGFAIPSNQIERTVKEVQTKGRIAVPYLGVRYIMINKILQKENNLPFDYGALLLRGSDVSQLAIIPGSPGDKAGLEENDIILEIDGKKLTEDQPLAKIIAQKEVGNTISLKIWHDGQERMERVLLEERPDNN